MSSRPDRDMLIAEVAENGLWASADGSMQWTQLGQGTGSEAITNKTTSIVYDPDPTNHPGTFWQSGAYGPCIYETTDNGVTFAKLGNATHCDTVSVDFTDPARQTLLAGGHESHIVYRSGDGGKTWVDVGPNIPAEAGTTGFVLALGPQIHLVGTWAAAAAGVFRTTDAGATWSRVFTGAVRSHPLVASDGGIYWVLQSNGLIVSMDQGATWAHVAGSEVIVSTEQGLVELPNGKLAGPGGTNLMISADHGASWRALGPVFPSMPWGITYSKFRKAFLAWHADCNVGAPNPVSADAIVSFDFDSSLL